MSHNDGSSAEEDIPIGSRFVNGTGTTKDNGATNHYTGYINHGEYSSISLGNAHRTDDANFIVEVMCQDTEDDDYKKHAQVTVESDLGDGPLKVFCDDYIFAVEPGIWGVGDGWNVYEDLTISSPTQMDAVHRRSTGSYEHCERGCNCLYCLNGRCHPDNYSYPHEAPEDLESWPGRIGMWGLCGREFDDYEWYNPPIGTDPASGMSAFTRLKDDNDLFKAPGEHNVDDAGVKSRVYGKRYGVYFFVSYGGKELATGILNSGEYAMDLTKINAHFDWNLFETGKVEITNVQESSGGLGIGDVAGAIVEVCAVLSTSTGWSVAFYALGATFQIIDEVDLNSGEESNAQGAVYVFFTHNTPGGGHNETKWDREQRDEDGTLSWTGLSCSNSGVGCTLGDQWLFWVELESVGYVKTQVIEGVEASCRTKFKCDNSDDWNFWEVMVGPGSP
jgi:hypothetical protein